MPKQVEITPEVRETLGRSTLDHNNTVVVLPPEQLSRPQYEAVDKVLRALGGKWDRRLRGHVFPRAVDGQLAEALAAGRAVDTKRTLEQFFTPPEIARQVLDLAGDIEGVEVLEPSAGAGAIALEAMRRGAIVTAIEIDRELVSALCSETEGRMNIACFDFLEWSLLLPPLAQPYDVVLMNPPFRRGLDLAHVWRAFGLVRPGGRLVSVMSPHWTFAQDRATREFREEVRRRDHSWTELPPGTFKAEGTGVNTGILVIDKEQRP